MADINVERTGPSIWPWILGLLVLALVLWGLVEAFDSDEPEVAEEPVAAVVEPAPVVTAPPPGPAEAGPAAVPAPVQQYVTACAPREPAAMGLDHGYTSNCITLLVGAIDAVLQTPNLAGVDVQAQMQDARQKADRLTQSPNTSAQHAGMTRDAFLSAAAVLNGIQDARYPSLDAQTNQLDQTAQSVQTSQNLLDQREPVQRFFQQAGEVLTGIAMTPAAGV